MLSWLPLVKSQLLGGILALSDTEMNAAADDLFQSDPGRLVFLRVDLNARLCPTLQLLASLRCQNDKSVFRINLRRFRRL